MDAGSPGTAAFPASGQSRVPGTLIRPVFPQWTSYFPPHFLFSPFGAPPPPWRDWSPLCGPGSTRRLGSPDARAPGFPEQRPRGVTEGGPGSSEEEPRGAGLRTTRGCARPCPLWHSATASTGARKERRGLVLQLGTLPGALESCASHSTHRHTRALTAELWSHRWNRCYPCLFFLALCI